MGLCHTIFELMVISVKNCKNSPAMYFAPQLKGFPLELSTGAGVQKSRMMGLPGRKRSLSISPAVWIQYMHMTDRLTPGDSKDPHLCIASCGKNCSRHISGVFANSDVKLHYFCHNFDSHNFTR